MQVPSPTAGLQFLAHSLSGRLLLLTLGFVLVIEAVISIPSIARHHRALLEAHISAAELAILPFTEITGEQFSGRLRGQLLERAGAAAVILKRREQRELFLVRRIPARLDRVVDLRRKGLWTDIAETFDCLTAKPGRALRIVAATRIPKAETVEVILTETPIRTALLDYASRIALVGLLISLAAALLVFLSLYFVLVRPMGRMSRAMLAFRENPEDPSRILTPSARRDEIGIAERELSAMQREIAGSLQQKTRLAALGLAVAKIQHDLRNILSSAQLASDRLSRIEDPVVQRLSHRLIAALDRAASLAANTLRYGRAEERAPERQPVALAALVNELAELLPASLVHSIDPDLRVMADPEQLHRILLNLLRNANEALQGKGSITISATSSPEGVTIDITDTGPGIAEAVRHRLFEAFASGQGGSGLGLVIARDLARGHGGDVTLVRSGADGTVFRVVLP